MKQDDPHYDARRAEYYAQGWWRDEDLWTSMSRTALARPAQPAFIGEDRAITFGELLRDAERFGRGLAARGINPGDVVILHARNSVETVVALVGCAWAGAVMAGVPPMFSAAQVASVVTNSAARAVVCLGDAKELAEALRGARDAAGVTLVVAPDGVAGGEGVESWNSLLAAGDAWRSPRPTVGADDLALLAYSSGTTGAPKGVMHSANTVRYAIEQRALLHGVTADDICLVVGQFGFVGNVVFGLLAGALLGTTSVLMRSWNADRALGLMERHRVSYGLFLSTHVHDLLDSPRLAATDLSRFRHAAMGGLSAERRLEVRRRLCPYPLPGYGMSECLGNSTCSADDAEDKLLNREGRPYPGTEIRIVDANGAPLPAGEAGEVQVRGPSRTFGYYHAPELTRAALTGDGFFRTGDLGRLDADGCFTFAGREKEIIRRGGVTIVPGEVEAVLIEHPRIDRVAIVALPDPRMGERACACVITADGAPVTLDELSAFLAARGVARYQWPERVERFAEFPFTPSLKVRKQGLVDLVIARDRTEAS